MKQKYEDYSSLAQWFICTVIDLEKVTLDGTGLDVAVYINGKEMNLDRFLLSIRESFDSSVAKESERIAAQMIAEENINFNILYSFVNEIRNAAGNLEFVLDKMRGNIED